jgi:hypothetical protein
MLGTLIDLALRSATLRLWSRIGYRPHNDSPEARNRTHPWYVLNDGVLNDMERLGKHCRNGGTDLRATALWPIFEHQDAYEAKFEFRRLVTPEPLTPATIYECLDRGNNVLWHGWEIQVGSSRVVVDDFGQDTWESRIWVESPDKAFSEFSGISKRTARALYEYVTGHAFAGEDTLGYDRPHPAEGVPWWMINEDGSVDEPNLAAHVHDKDCSVIIPFGLTYDTVSEGRREFLQLASADRTAWLGQFDEDGRYLARDTGFWASLNGECYDPATHTWESAYDDDSISSEYRDLEPGEALEIGDEYLVDGAWKALTEKEYAEWVTACSHYWPDEGMAPFRRPLGKTARDVERTRTIYDGALRDAVLAPLLDTHAYREQARSITHH